MQYNSYFMLAASLLILGVVVFAGCTSSTTSNSVSVGSLTTQSAPPSGSGPGGQNGPSGGNMTMSQSGPSGTPPSGGSGSGGPGGAPGGGSFSSSSYTFNGTYILNGGTETLTTPTYLSTTKDTSGVYVTNGGILTLINPTITTSGDSSSTDASSFYGLNGGVLVNNGSSVSITGGSITTTGSGANGVIPTGTGSTATLTDVTITASGGAAHGVMATQGGNLILNNVTISTSGGSGAPYATDRGSGTVLVYGGSAICSGRNSPGIYSTGNITVVKGTITSTGSEAAVIEGFNSITLFDASLSGIPQSTGGVMIYQSMSGDASTGTGTFTMTGGSLSISGDGPTFFVTNTKAVITLSGVQVTSTSNSLIDATGTSRWGNTGSNGGSVTFNADNEKLTGNLICDNISAISASLTNGSILTGPINSAALTLDATSSWNVTGDSVLTTLSDTNGISGTSITNIVGNGHTVTYDTNLSANSALGGKTYSLSGGGELVPE